MKSREPVGEGTFSLDPSANDWRERIIDSPSENWSSVAQIFFKFFVGQLNRFLGWLETVRPVSQFEKTHLPDSFFLLALGWTLFPTYEN
jgi:hypothetical protein